MPAQKTKTKMPKTLGTTAARREQARATPTSRKRYDSQEKANRWMITLNFGTEDELESMSEQATIAMRRLNAAAQVPPTTFAIFQPEKGEENGRLHIQAYFEFEKRLSLAQVRKHVGESCFVEPAQGTQDECIAYCSKEGEGGRVEGAETTTFGTPMKLNRKGGTSGSRTDWADVLKMTIAGESNLTILQKHPSMFPHMRAISHVRFAAQCERSRSEPTKLLVFWGCPDAGKTTTAISLCDPGTYFVLAADGKGCWWDGYDPDRHKTIILDEFVGSRMPLTLLNQLCDSIDLNVQTKGGFVRMLAERVIITSNFSPREWYNACVEARQESLFRRISTEVEFMLVDEIIDMKRDASKTQKMLHLIVHKGYFNWGLTKSRYKFDACCGDKYLKDAHLLDESEQSSPLVERLAATPEDRLDSSMDSEDEVAFRKARRRSYVESQSSPIEISSDEEEEDHPPKRQRPLVLTGRRSIPMDDESDNFASSDAEGEP